MIEIVSVLWTEVAGVSASQLAGIPAVDSNYNQVHSQSINPI